MEKYLVLKTDGTIEEVDVNSYESSYKALSENIGGIIQCIRWVKPFAARGIDLWIHDEGKLLDLDLSLAITDKGRVVEVLNGNIVFARYNLIGDTLPLSDDDIAFIKETLQIDKRLITYDNPYTGTYLENFISVV